jgi:hypothetical protein
MPKGDIMPKLAEIIQEPINDYKKLDQECTIVLEKIKTRKKRKAKAVVAVVEKK